MSISNSVGTQTAIASSSIGIQTPKKAHLHRKIQNYKRQIAALELKCQKDQEKDIDILFAQLDKFYPKEMSDFLKQQAYLLQKKVKGRRYTIAFKQYCLSLYFSSPRTYKQLKNKLFCLPSKGTL